MVLKESLIKLTMEDKQLHFETSFLMDLVEEISFQKKTNLVIIGNFQYFKNATNIVIASSEI